MVQAATTHLVGSQRLRTVLDERVGTHIIVRADHQAAQSVHQGAVAIAAVARPEEITNQRLQAPVAQPAVQVGEELVLLGWPYVVDRLMHPGLFEQRIVLLLINGAGIIEHGRAHGMAVAPKVLVVLFDRRAYLT